MQPIFQLIDVSITNKDEMCGASQLAANECKGIIKSKMPFTFQLIVESKQVHQSKPQIFLVNTLSSNAISNHGPNQHKSSCASQLVACAKCITSHESSCASLLAECAKYLIKINTNLQTTNNFQQGAMLHFNVSCLHELIVNSNNPSFEGAQAAPNHSHQLIDAFKYSKISLHFCKDFRIFCEGDWSSTTTKMRSEITYLNYTYLNNIFDMKVFGHNKPVKLINSLVSPHKLNGLINGLVRHHKLIKLINGLVGHHKLIQLINGHVGHNKLIKLINGFEGHHELNKLVNGLVGPHKLNKLINGLVGRHELIKLIDGLVSNHELIKLILTAFGHNKLI
jgi:hypothetical protein